MNSWIFLVWSTFATLPFAQQRQVAEQADAAEVSGLTPGEWPAGVVEKSQLESEGAYSYEFQEIDLSKVKKWLSWFDIAVPEASGKVSGWIWVKPSGGWLEWSNYLVEAQLSSPLLKIDPWSFQSAKLRVGFSQNTWYLGTLEGTFVDQATTALAKVKIVGKLPLNDTPELTMNGKLDEVHLDALLAAFGIDLSIENRDGQIEIQATSKLDSITDLAAWRAVGSLELLQLVVEATAAGDILADFDLADGQWQLTDGRWNLGKDEAVNFDAGGSLENSLPFQFSAKGEGLQLSQLDQRFTGSRLEPLSSLDGKLHLDVQLKGTSIQGLSAMEANVELSDLQYSNTALGRLGAKFEVLPSSTTGMQADDAQQEPNSQGPAATLRVNYELRPATRLEGLAYWPKYLDIAQGVPQQISIDAWGVDMQKDISQKLALVLKAVPDIGMTSEQVQFFRQINGQIDAQLRLANLQSSNERLKWSCDSRIRFLGLSLAGTSLGDHFIQLEKELDRDRVALRLWDRGTNLQLKADIDLREDGVSFAEQFAEMRYQADLELAQFKTHVQASPADSRLSLTIDGHASVQGKAGEWLEEGVFEISSLKLTNKKGRQIELRDLTGNIRPDVFQLQRFVILAQGGRLGGQAEWQRRSGGQHLIRLTARQFSAWDFLADEAGLSSFGLAASLSFDFKASKPADVDDLLKGWQAKLAGRLEQIEILQRSLGDVAFQGNLAKEQLSLLLDADLLEGQLAATFDAQLSGGEGERNNETPVQLGPWKSELNWQNLNLNKAVQMAASRSAMPEVRGKASIQLQASGQGSQPPQGQLSVRIPNIQIANRRLVDSLELEGELAENQLRIQRALARVAGGRLQLVGQLGMRNSVPQGDMQVVIQGLELQAIEPLLEQMPISGLSGSVGFRGKVRLDSKASLDGTVVANEIELNGFTASSMRGNLRSQYDWSGNRLDARLRDLHGTAFGGRLRGELELNATSRWALKSSLSLERGQMDDLSQALGFQRVVGTGRFNANAKISSADLQKLNRLSGPVNFDFQGGDVASFPVLGDVQNLLLLPNLPSISIQGGYLRGQLGQGQFRIKELFLGSNAYWVLAAGATSLQNQKLDINAVLQTDDSLGMSEFARWSSEKLLLVIAPQLALLVELNELVSNRTLYLHIGGTPKYPVIQPQAAQTLTANIISQLQRRLLASPTAGNVPIALP